jgi:hypothetical protein
MIMSQKGKSSSLTHSMEKAKRIINRLSAEELVQTQTPAENNDIVGTLIVMTETVIPNQFPHLKPYISDISAILATYGNVLLLSRKTDEKS